MAMTLLATQNLWKSFGGVTAVQDISLSVEEGEIIGMIGPNGSGKTTFINLLSGIYRPDRGHILFKGEDVAGKPAYEISKRGVARTFQNLRLFPNITVQNNLLIGSHCTIPYSLLDVYFRPFLLSKREKQAVDRTTELLRGVNLIDKKDEPAKSLAYGEQRLLEICRALASEPALLLLDEPCAGMNPVEMDILAVYLRSLKKSGITIFIIEHNMHFIMAIAERIIVLNAGVKFKEGLPAEIQNDRQVQEIYLGEEETCFR